MQLYCDHVRPQLLKVDPDKLDPKDGSLTFFVNNKGGKCTKIDGAFDWFKREVVEAGLQTEDDLRYLQVSSNFHFLLVSTGKLHLSFFLRQKHIMISDSPRAQGCRQDVSGVPPNIESTDFFLLMLYYIGCRRLSYLAGLPPKFF
jgi:hypothetical protein